MSAFLFSGPLHTHNLQTVTTVEQRLLYPFVFLTAPGFKPSQGDMSGAVQRDHDATLTWRQGSHPGTGNKLSFGDARAGETKYCFSRYMSLN